MINYILCTISGLSLIIVIFIATKLLRRNRPEDLLLCINAYVSYLSDNGTLTLLDIVKLCEDHNVDFNTCEAIALSLSIPPQKEEETYLS